MYTSQALLALGFAIAASCGPVGPGKGPADGPGKPGPGPPSPPGPGKGCKPGPNDGKFDYNALSLREVGARNTLVRSKMYGYRSVLRLRTGLENLARAQMPANLILARCATLP